MQTLEADLNARTVDDKIRLSAKVSETILGTLDVKDGSWVLLTQDDVRVPAQLEVTPKGILARPMWDLMQNNLLEATEETPDLAFQCYQLLQSLYDQLHLKHEKLQKQVQDNSKNVCILYIVTCAIVVLILVLAKVHGK
jgi:hypothetical protein